MSSAKPRGCLRRALIALPIVVLAALFFVRAFIADVLPVKSGSMEPTLFGEQPPHDWVFVRYGTPRPWRRFDLVVFRQEGSDLPVVKRIVGLPGETVQLADGDLFVDGRRVSAPGIWFEVWNDESPRFDGAPSVGFGLDHENRDGGRRVGGEDQVSGWTLGGADGTDRVFLTRDVDLGYALPASRGIGDKDSDSPHPSRVAVHGTQANDLRVRGEFRVPAAGAMDDAHPALEFELTEAGDRFTAVIEPLDDGTAALRMERGSLQAGLESEMLASAELRTALDAWLRFEFSNRDNTLCLAIDGAVVLEHTYASNRPSADSLGANKSGLGPRVALTATGFDVELRRVRIERELTWLGGSAFGTHATTEPARLGLDELFVLGDNSADSMDSRRYGPIKTSAPVGRASFVVWPRARWRRLR